MTGRQALELAGEMQRRPSAETKAGNHEPKILKQRTQSTVCCSRWYCRRYVVRHFAPLLVWRRFGTNPRALPSEPSRVHHAARTRHIGFGRPNDASGTAQLNRF